MQSVHRTPEQSPPGMGQGWVGVWACFNPNHTSSTTTPQPTPLSPPWRGTTPCSRRQSDINPPPLPTNPHATAFHSPPGRGQGWVGVWTCFAQNTPQASQPLNPPLYPLPGGERLRAPGANPISTHHHFQPIPTQPHSIPLLGGARGGLAFLPVVLNPPLNTHHYTLKITFDLVIAET
jgi:hypothetical protein